MFYRNDDLGPSSMDDLGPSYMDYLGPVSMDDLCLSSMEDFGSSTTRLGKIGNKKRKKHYSLKSCL